MQLTFAANLHSTGFPLWTSLQGRTVLVGKADQPKRDSANTTTNRNLIGIEMGTPEIMYIENAIPTVHGYKSVAFSEAIAAYTGLDSFIDIIEIRNDIEAVTFLASSASSKVYLFDSLNAAWKEVGNINVVFGDMTTAFSSGVTYVCFKLSGIFKVNLDTLELEPVTLIGLTGEEVIGITSSNNYLIVHDGESVYWSSAVDSLDFVPSASTGAGSGIPTELKGKIIHITELATGFAVYSNSNIVVASFSGNIRYPWIFKEGNNGAGIIAAGDVSNTGQDGTNYAWTSAGLLRVALTGATLLLPEITDYLAGRVIETFDDTTNVLSYEYLTSPLQVRVTFSSSRYIVVSYGKTTMTHALLYDVALKRLGKIKLDHIKVFELPLNLSTGEVRYKDLVDITYEDLLEVAYEDIKVATSQAAEPRRLLAFLQSDGSVKVAVMDYGNFTANGVLILGKYQLVRSHLMSVQELEVEGIDSANPNFDLKLLSSIDGKNFLPASTPYKAYEANNVKKYLTDVVGTNHSVLIKGAFNLVSLDLTISTHGKE